MINKLKNIKNNFLYSIKIAFEASKFYTIIRIIARIGMPLLSLLKTYFLKIILDTMVYSFSNEIKRQNVIFQFSLIILISIIEFIISKIVSYCEGIHQNIIEQHIQENLVKKAIESDLLLYDNPEYYDRLNSATTDSYSFATILWTLFECISAGITFVSSFIVLFAFNAVYSIIIVLFAIPAAIINYKYTKSLYKLELSQIKTLREKNYYFDLATTKSSVQEIHLYRSEDYIKRYYHDLWLKLFKNKKHMLQRKTMFSSLLEIIPVLLVLLFTIIIALNVIDKEISVGNYTLYSNMFQQLLSGITIFIGGIATLIDNSLRIENVRKFQNIPNSIIDCGKKELRKIESIDFVNVTFFYPQNSTAALDGFSLHIEKGDKIAIVGKNGSGKSTLMKLLMRFYEPSKGVILINNVDIKTFTVSSLRSVFSCYFQNTSNYAFTIRNNITFSDLQQNNNENLFNKAINKAGCKEFISKLDLKENTYVTRLFEPNGVELSGGENQRLALARTFFKNAQIILLDEPTSALDPKAEKELLDELKEYKDNILIITSHKLTNIVIADKIILMDAGRIIEMGTKEELFNTDSEFNKLYSFQINTKEQFL